MKQAYPGEYWAYMNGSTTMAAMGVIGLGLAAAALVFALSALEKISKLREQLKAAGVLADQGEEK
jgi:hypothetical protein